MTVGVGGVTHLITTNSSLRPDRIKPRPSWKKGVANSSVRLMLIWSDLNFDLKSRGARLWSSEDPLDLQVSLEPGGSAAVLGRVLSNRSTFLSLTGFCNVCFLPQAPTSRLLQFIKPRETQRARLKTERVSIWVVTRRLRFLRRVCGAAEWPPVSLWASSSNHITPHSGRLITLQPARQQQQHQIIWFWACRASSPLRLRPFWSRQPKDAVGPDLPPELQQRMQLTLVKPSVNVVKAE